MSRHLTLFRIGNKPDFVGNKSFASFPFASTSPPAVLNLDCKWHIVRRIDMADNNTTVTGEKNVRRFFLLHLKPASLLEPCLKFTHTFGLGGSALVLFLLLVVSGMGLKLVYEASPENAYRSTFELYTRFRFAGLVRNVHYISANLLFGVVILHLLRVFYTGAFHGPRRFNWIIGLLLFFGVMSASFTGYLLPWDQLAFWAITISTSMLEYVPFVGEPFRTLSRGGAEIGPSTLVMYYALHTSFIPFAIASLMGFHFWRIRKVKGVILPLPVSWDDPPPEVERVPVYPHLLIRELAMGLAVIAFVLLMSVFFDAPLGEAANAGVSPNPSKAPWYFMAFQELQLHFHPFFAAVVIPLAAVIALGALPYLRYERKTSGPWFLSDKGRRLVAVCGGAALITVPLLVVMDDLWFKPSSGVSSLVARGLFPFAAMAGFAFLFVRLLRKRFKATGEEAGQALFTVVFVSILVLTVIGIWFRGKGMSLTLPFATGF
jgi:quinol-cytochrome oxidoreductase complex cytochrome b subunit